MLIPNRANTPFSGVPKDQTGCCRQGLGPNSTSVMPGIEMERAFSALAWPVWLPSPLGWAGMMGAFGAPWFAGQRCPRTLSRNLQTPVPAARGEL